MPTDLHQTYALHNRGKVKDLWMGVCQDGQAGHSALAAAIHFRTPATFWIQDWWEWRNPQIKASSSAGINILGIAFRRRHGDANLAS
jgi:hypothetical protein